MTDDALIASYYTMDTLLGTTVPLETIIDRLRHTPLDRVLGVVNLFAMRSLSPGGNESFQRHALMALIQQLKRTFSLTGDQLQRLDEAQHSSPFVLVHPHNAAFLTHLALTHAREDALTERLDDGAIAEVLWLLLAVADHLSSPIASADPTPLLAEKHMALALLRQWQFQPQPDGRTIYQRLARYAQLYLAELPQASPGTDYNAVFRASTQLDLDTYFQNVAALIAHYLHDLSARPDAAWLTPDLLLAKVTGDRAAFETLLGRWSATPTTYRIYHKNTVQGTFGRSFLDEFNFVALRRTPLIEARPGEFVMPVPHFFFENMINEPYFVITDALASHDRQAFWGALGAAFESYATTLITSVAQHDQKGPWRVMPSPQSGGDELTDVYLQREHTGIAFELKALRLPNPFLAGLPDDTVLGPTDHTLRDHAATPLTPQDVRDRNRLKDPAQQGDKGLLSRGMYQHTIHGPALRAFAAGDLGQAPTRVYPLLVHLADVRVDEVVYRGYLARVIKAFQLYPDSFWHSPAWLHIEDVEMLAALAEHHGLDLERFLSSMPTGQRFDVALWEAYHSTGTALPALLTQRFTVLMREAQRSLFPKTAVSTPDAQTSGDEPLPPTIS